MRKIDVLFFIEHVDRELDAATCIVERLQRTFGIQCEIRNFYADMKFCLRRYDPAIVVSPFFYFLDHHPMKDYVAAWPRAAVFNMAWEQILYKVHTNVKVPKDRFAREQVTHVCWTGRYRDAARAQGADPDRLLLTGNPVMKFYDAPYRSYFKSRAELARAHGLDPSRKWILFPENYRWAFLSEAQLHAVAQQDADPAELAEAAAYCKRSLRTLFSWLGGISGPDAPIMILRPRPATSVQEMTSFQENATDQALPNVRIIKADSAREWILAADHVVSSYSTTLIEAALAGKPIHVFAPEPIPDALHDEWYALVPTLADRESFARALCDTADAGTGDRLAAWARATLLPAGDPLEAISQAIATLRASCSPRETSDAPDHMRLTGGQLLVERARKLLQRQHAYHRWLHRLDRRYLFTSQKHEKDVFGADDVAARIARWRNVLGSDNSAGHG